MKSSAPDGPNTASQVSNNNDIKSENNFDDDNNEWEFAVNDLIIDLDADIERNNEEKLCGQQETSQQRVKPVGTPVYAQCNSEESELLNQQAKTSMSSVEHSATVDKGLKMKIKRKTVSAKSSEPKHEIVESGSVPVLTALVAMENGETMVSGDTEVLEKTPCGEDQSIASNSANADDKLHITGTEQADGNKLAGVEKLPKSRPSGNHRRDKVKEKCAKPGAQQTQTFNISTAKIIGAGRLTSKVDGKGGVVRTSSCSDLQAAAAAQTVEPRGLAKLAQQAQVHMKHLGAGRTEQSVLNGMQSDSKSHSTQKHSNVQTSMAMNKRHSAKATKVNVALEDIAKKIKQEKVRCVNILKFPFHKICTEKKLHKIW